MEKVELGDRVKDSITGFEGIVTGVFHWITGCDTCQVKPQDLLKEGTSIASESFDVTRLEILKKGVIKIDIPTPNATTSIECGDKVRDKITPFSGIVTGVFKWLTGSATCQVQPQELKDNKSLEAEVFDAVRLDVLKKGAIKVDHQIIEEEVIEDKSVKKKITKRPGGPKDNIEQKLNP